MNSIRDLPTEVLGSILILLSAPSFLACRAVCKRWKFIIESDDVCRNHFTCSKNPYRWEIYGENDAVNWARYYPSVNNEGDDAEAYVRNHKHRLEHNGRRYLEGATLWRCGRITKPGVEGHQEIDGHHEGPCAPPGGWYVLLRDVAFLDYLSRLIDADNAELTPPDGGNRGAVIHPIMFGHNLLHVNSKSDIEEEAETNSMEANRSTFRSDINETAFRRALNGIVSSGVIIEVYGDQIPKTCMPDEFLHTCYDIVGGAKTDTETACLPWHNLRAEYQTWLSSPNYRPERGTWELMTGLPLLHEKCEGDESRKRQFRPMWDGERKRLVQYFWGDNGPEPGLFKLQGWDELSEIMSDNIRCCGEKTLPPSFGPSAILKALLRLTEYGTDTDKCVYCVKVPMLAVMFSETPVDRFWLVKSPSGRLVGLTGQVMKK
ncbi:hypothetical protein HK104_000289 [Borealophlyctis nickersoniae]|nr:hypothetical protein HK104_000289 [Borealophlyctis nickersoniae]